MDALTVSVRDAATLLGIGRTKVYELIQQRQLSSLKIGSRTLVTTASIRELVAGRITHVS